MLALYDYPKTRDASGVHLVAEGELRRRRRRRVRVPLRRAGRRAHDRRQRGHALAPPPAKEPGHTSDTFAKATQEAFMKEYRAKYPDRPELQPRNDETYAAPPRYNSVDDHFQQLLRCDADAACGGRRCGVRTARRRSGAAREPQLLREPSDRLGRREDDANVDRVALMKREAALILSSGRPRSSPRSPSRLPRCGRQAGSGRLRASRGGHVAICSEYADRERAGGRLAPAVRWQDGVELARLSTADAAVRVAGHRRRAHSRRARPATS